MARKFSETERDYLIDLIGQYVLETGASTRETAKYISDTYGKVSNATVSNYLKIYKQNHPKIADKLQNKIDSNGSRNIDSKKLEFRVYNHTKLLLSGLTIKEIEALSGNSYWTIYYDINTRLAKMDKKLHSQVKELMKLRSKDNLGIGSK